MENHITNKLPLKDFVDLEVWQAEKLDAMAQRVAKILNGYMRSTLARKQLNPGERFQGSQAL